MRHRSVPLQAAVSTLLLAAIITATVLVPGLAGRQPAVLRLATTTSTADTGLLAAILPAFERQCRCRVDVIAVGTGQALAMGRIGDVDVVLVHARKAEDQFLAEGHARERFDVMYNDFVIVGPAADPAKVNGMTMAREAFAAIAKASALFASRGDKSGTHAVELGIWTDLKQTPVSPWYRSLGQGMGETLIAANEMGAYTLSDRATWLATREKVTGLRQFVGGARLAENRDRTLLNYYGVLPVSADTHPGAKMELAQTFARWLTAADTQKAIGSFGVARFGQPLFYPDSDDYKATREVRVTAGVHTATLAVADLKAFPRVTLANHRVIGVKKGVLGPYAWTGASLVDVLKKVDPSITHSHHAGSRIVVRSSDGWEVTLWWDELFATVPQGFGLYNVKGCNECHGPRGEGTSPAGKRPAPALAGIDWPLDGMCEILRTGGAMHAGMLPFTPEQLSHPDVTALVAWLKHPHVTHGVAPYVPPATRLASVLAYERDGREMAGAEGLIQLVVGPDDYAARYSHWVSSIDVVPPGR